MFTRETKKTFKCFFLPLKDRKTFKKLSESRGYFVVKQKRKKKNLIQFSIFTLTFFTLYFVIALRHQLNSSIPTSHLFFFFLRKNSAKKSRVFPLTNPPDRTNINNDNQREEKKDQKITAQVLHCRKRELLFFTHKQESFVPGTHSVTEKGTKTVTFIFR